MHGPTSRNSTNGETVGPVLMNARTELQGRSRPGTT